MKQTAVEWLANELYEKFEMRGDGILYDEILNKAKELEEKQRNEFAIEFAKYIDKNYWQGQRSNQYSKLFGGNDKTTIEKILEIYKKENL